MVCDVESKTKAACLGHLIRLAPPPEFLNALEIAVREYCVIDDQNSWTGQLRKGALMPPRVENYLYCRSTCIVCILDEFLQDARTLAILGKKAAEPSCQWFNLTDVELVGSVVLPFFIHGPRPVECIPPTSWRAIVS